MVQKVAWRVVFPAVDVLCIAHALWSSRYPLQFLISRFHRRGRTVSSVLHLLCRHRVLLCVLRQALLDHRSPTVQHVLKVVHDLPVHARDLVRQPVQLLLQRGVVRHQAAHLRRHRLEVLLPHVPELVQVAFGHVQVALRAHERGQPALRPVAAAPPTTTMGLCASETPLAANSASAWTESRPSPWHPGSAAPYYASRDSLAHFAPQVRLGPDFVAPLHLPAARAHVLAERVRQLRAVQATTGRSPCPSVTGATDRSRARRRTPRAHYSTAHYSTSSSHRTSSAFTCANG